MTASEQQAELRAVLIVPLWNWNDNSGSSVAILSSGFNRTFMELKYNFKLNFEQFYQVLIVPLWNWNQSGKTTFVYDKKVLIVPLWNWNSVISLYLALNERFNRTFMELKSDTILYLPALPAVLIVPLWNWNSVNEEKDWKLDQF